MDMVAIDTIEGRVLSFLSVTWGIIADIDIESERFRKLGNARFTVEGLYKIFISKFSYYIIWMYLFSLPGPTGVARRWWLLV